MHDGDPLASLARRMATMVTVADKMTVRNITAEVRLGHLHDLV
jgi:hypothetical protein